MLHGNEKAFSNQDHYTRMFSLGGRKQTNKQKQFCQWCNNLLQTSRREGWNGPGCAEVALVFKGLAPAQSWRWGELLGLLSLKGKRK